MTVTMAVAVAVVPSPGVIVGSDTGGAVEIVARNRPHATSMMPMTSQQLVL